MGYLVKASINSEPRAYALEGIRTDLQAGFLPPTALTRPESQDFWYSVAELVGDQPTPGFRYLCPQCKGWLTARGIDIGLPVKCGQCGDQSTVPDIKARQQTVLDHDVLKSARSKMIAGIIMAGVGLLATAASYMNALKPEGGVYGIFYGLVVVGAGTFHMGWQRRSQFFSKYPQAKN